MKRTIGILLISLVAAGFAWAQNPEHQALLKKIDNLTNFENLDFSSTANLVIARPDKDKEAMSVKFFRRDKDDKFVIIIDKPDVKKGQGYLKMDDNVWFYDPNTREFSHSSLKENFSDSDSQNADFAKSDLANDYTVTEFTKEKLGSAEVYKLQLTATADTVSYAFKTMWVTVGDVPLVLQEEDFSRSKKLMRTSKYKNYEKIEGRYIWKTALFVNNLVAGEFTQLNMKDISLGKIPDKVFTKVYLAQVSK